jgi:urease accessory protein UreH
MSANSLRLEAHGRDGTTVVGTIRGTGLLRASRPFAEGAAARVIVGHLGPGMVRGDAFATSGRVATGAHLIVAGQMAMRILSGPDPATSSANWIVERDACLELIAEPTLIAAGASYDARLEIALEPGARAAVTELVRRESGAALRIATIVHRGERAALVDVLHIDAGDPDDAAIGTLALFGPCDLDAIDRAADRCSGVRIGIGRLRDGDTLARIVGAGTWAVREALYALRAAVTLR